MAKKKAPKVWPGTKPTQIRLTKMDKTMVEQIRVWKGLPSASAAIRHAVQIVHLDVPKKILEKFPGDT